MAKISEMSKQELEKYILAFEKKIQTGEDTEENQEKLVKLKAALNKIEAPKSEEENTIEKFHSQEVDYTDYKDAGTASRAVALIVDGVLLGVANNIILYVVKMATGSGESPKEKMIFTGLSLILYSAISLGYHLYFLKIDGQTLGKKLLKIKIIYNDSNEQLGTWTIILREFIGKTISSLVFMLGYIVRVFGFTAWHDSIAGTKVIKVK